MGEFADMERENGDWAWEQGALDEDPRPGRSHVSNSVQQPHWKTCKFCGVGNLRWHRYESGAYRWELRDKDNKVHRCLSNAIDLVSPTVKVPPALLDKGFDTPAEMLEEVARINLLYQPNRRGKSVYERALRDFKRADEYFGQGWDLIGFDEASGMPLGRTFHQDMQKLRAISMRATRQHELKVNVCNKCHKEKNYYEECDCIPTSRF